MNCHSTSAFVQSLNCFFRMIRKEVMKQYTEDKQYKDYSTYLLKPLRAIYSFRLVITFGPIQYNIWQTIVNK